MRQDTGSNETIISKSKKAIVPCQTRLKYRAKRGQNTGSNEAKIPGQVRPKYRVKLGFNAGSKVVKMPGKRR